MNATSENKGNKENREEADGRKSRKGIEALRPKQGLQNFHRRRDQNTE